MGNAANVVLQNIQATYENGILKFWQDDSIVDVKELYIDGSAVTSFITGGIVSATALTLKSTDPMTIQLNATDALQLDNAAIASFAAAADTAGNSVFIETEDGGVDTAVDGGSNGGLLTLLTGTGSAGGAAQTGGIGGALTIRAGLGGAGGSTSGIGGAGGATTLRSGIGGAGTGSGNGGVGGAYVSGGSTGGASATGAGGVGGVAECVAGAGGATSAGTGDGGVGGAATFGSGAGGASFGGSDGANGTMTFQIGAVDILQYHDAAISAFAAATDTVGKDLYAETQDAGGTATAARVGGFYSFKTGDGSAGTTTVDSGAGGAITFTTGLGGAHTGGGAGGIGGASGAFSLVTSPGGATSNVGADNGGAGGAFTITGGAGGLASAGTGDGGAGAGLTFTAGAGGNSEGGTAGVGGDITLTPGAGGAGNGTAGAPGKVSITTGMFLHTSPQAINLGGGTVAVTLVPGTPAGTLLTSNILIIDGGNAGTIKMPPEANCDGAVFFIRNSGSDTVTVQNDAAGAITAYATTKAGIITCDGTNWFELGIVA